MSEIHIPKVAILASGNGTTADAYARALYEGVVTAEIGVVITNNQNAGIVDRVKRWNRDYGFDTELQVINNHTHPLGNSEHGQTDEESEAITETLERVGVGTVALLGYMRIVRGTLLREYGYHPDEHVGRMINTHPGPLPETANTHGPFTARRVLELGLTESRHTVHQVSASVDAGPIVASHPFPVRSDDTIESLTQRSQLVEKATIPYAIDKFIRSQQALAGRNEGAIM